MQQFESEYQVRGVKLRMFRGGTGEPVLFLHGAAGLSFWTPFFQSLSQQHDFIAIEHPGYGKSDDPENLTSMQDLAAFYLDVIDQLGVGKVHLIGSSLGGWLASEIAIRDSSRVKSLTVVAPAGLRNERIPVPDMLSWSPQELTRKVYFDPAIAEQILAQTPTEQQRQMLAKNRATTTKLGQAANFCSPTLGESLRHLEIPTFILWGDTDKVTPTAYAEYWKEHMPNARLSIIPECGHLPHFEKADVAAAQIKAFLQTVA
jgi:pimeloyl-ACP methyl ester carboxylesterase